MKTFISYNLGFKEKANFKATAGNAVHKALELLGLYKYAIQKGEHYIENEIFDNPYSISNISIDHSFHLGWEFYKKTHPEYSEWNETKTILKYKKMYDELLKFRNGAYNPLNLNIIQPEQFFEFEIKEPWAKYEYDINGKSLSGYLKLRGTVDLITYNDEGYYTSIDWKTGRRVNWSKGDWFDPKTKEYKDLQLDKQLLLYYYALVKMLKTYDITSIIYYLQDGGPFELCFGEEYYYKAEEMIKKEFNELNNITLPKLTKHTGNSAENHYNKRKCGWCDFNKIQPKISTEKTVCEHFRTELISLGMDKVLDKHVKVENLNNYSGGGRSKVEKDAERD